jgi:hypothetical protein
MRYQFVPILAILLPIVGLADTKAQVTTVQSFMLERPVSPANLQTTLPSPIPQAVMADVASGNAEIRERFVYRGSTSTLNYVQFVVPEGTPLPTPSTFNITASTYFTAIIAVQTISVSTNAAYPSVQFSGSVASTEGALGSVTGTPGSLSFGYVNSGPVMFNTVLSSIAGVSSSYSASAIGTMTLVQVPVPTAECASPVVVITSPTITTMTNFVNLDASQSFDCGGQVLSYQWTVLNPLGSVTLYNPTSATAQARLNNGPGQYSMTITVTNASGSSATSTVLVNYVTQ